MKAEKYFIDVLEKLIGKQKITISEIQREFSLGYVKAYRVVEWMCEKGYAKNNSSDCIEILISKELFENTFWIIEKEHVQKQEQTSVKKQSDDALKELKLKVLELVVESNTVSISMIQRRFQIGYARAGNIVDWMEQKGYVSGNDGSIYRKVLITKKDLENINID
jgi:DNA segregation ATPase FtsK/SpoIIIE-like protein